MHRGAAEGGAEALTADAATFQGGSDGRRAREGSVLNNATVAARLEEIADLLEEQRANPFRVQAYRRAAETVRGLDREIGAVLAEGGRQALDELPYIGPGIAATIDQLIRLGHAGMLERLRGESDPVTLFQTLPGIGPTLAERIHDALQVDSLEALELAAHDGRLAEVPGFSAARIEAVRSVLSTRLGGGSRPPTPDPAPRPAVSTLLDIDRRYREDARADRLLRITPRRFNPRRRRWLPIGHYDGDGWHFTALFSNTARAHRLSKTDDWVVLFHYDGDHREAQHTVVTEPRGEMAGLRVVRGRERECRDYYRARGALSG